MKAIARRIGRLESALTPQGDRAAYLRSWEIAKTLYERRKRRYEAGGRPFYQGRYTTGMAWIECCKHCKRPYFISERGRLMAGAWQCIYCPYCEVISSRHNGSGVLGSTALTPEQEEAYSRGELKSD
jgi:hypothetical protein